LSDEVEPGPIAEFRARPPPDTAARSPRRRRGRREKSALITLRNYSLTKKGVSNYDWADPYGMAVRLSWPRFLLGFLCIYMGFTGIFAAAYTLGSGTVANARPGAFSDHFFFSMETLATVGYGEMYPATFYGHCVATVEILTGVVFTAILTGLVFVRFSKPRAKFIFAEHPVVTTHNGRSTLMLRVGNGRAAVLADARAKVSVLLSETSAEGTAFRRTHELALMRNTIPVFPLTWTLMHDIDEHSPLRHLDPRQFAQADVRLFVSFEARDPDLATVVHDLRDYAPSDVLFGMRYADVITTDEEGRPTADMTRMSDVEPE
jgi:inward rectifier potassium channel